MLHLLYISAFSILAFLAVGNLIRNMFLLGIESQRQTRYRSTPQGMGGVSNQPKMVPHPECLDDDGRVIDEPLLVMRSMTVDDARERLDALYNASPGGTTIDTEDE